jgi:hypothetical protein
MQALKIGALYFSAVFGVGFALGTVRTLWIAPRLGSRVAELIEAPVMFLAIILAARTLVGRHAELSVPAQWLCAGSFALVLMLLAEFAGALWLRGLSLAQYFAARDPVSSTVYFLLLGVFALLPFLMFLVRRRRPVNSA